MDSAVKSADEKYCHECGSVIRLKAEICPKCGIRQPPVQGSISGIPGHRRCNACGFAGHMKTWLANYNGPQFMALLLLLLWILPGVIFIAWGWGKYKCPQCGKVGENAPA
jgi:NMD protein affecting ribosome stability and mRNA decay